MLTFLSIIASYFVGMIVYQQLWFRCRPRFYDQYNQMYILDFPIWERDDYAYDKYSLLSYYQKYNSRLDTTSYTVVSDPHIVTEHQIKNKLFLWPLLVGLILCHWIARIITDCVSLIPTWIQNNTTRQTQDRYFKLCTRYSKSIRGYTDLMEEANEYYLTLREHNVDKMLL